MENGTICGQGKYFFRPGVEILSNRNVLDFSGAVTKS
jgi:hypothetical protein